MTTRLYGSVCALVLALAPLVLACDRQVEQRGYRGVGVEQVSDSGDVETKLDANQVPAALPPAVPGGPLASTVFKNVQVLGDLDVGEFTRIMTAMTNWVSPDQGCIYCHVEGDNASDAVYQKVVARRMLQMTQFINTQKEHVGTTGVTCYTCHRGNNIPKYVWYDAPSAPGPLGPAGNRAGQNTPVAAVGMTSLPYDPFTAFLRDKNDIRVQSKTALPSGNEATIQQAEQTYGLMMHISQSLGVNCTYCHNTRSFMPWDASSPARVNAWYAVRMVRHINQDYMTPLASVLPPNRKGPLGDPFKVNCATCHQGAAKPLLGVSMLKDYPELRAAVHGGQ